MKTQRYFVELAYKGTSFYGWQRQPKQISVQEVLEDIFTKLNSNHKVQVVGCGRTDTGVHAHHYVLHIDFPEVDDIPQLLFKLNRMLPDSIAVHSMKVVAQEMHARFDAYSRTYRYFIHRKKDPFITETSWLFAQELDILSMNKAAQLLIGTQDFTSFSKVNTDVKTNICTVTKAEWIKVDDEHLFFEITANRFLRNMVRSTVGTLLEVGLRKIAPDQIIEILAAKDRGAAALSVPAHGLFLWEVLWDNAE